jgi:hypothetical protein
MKYFLKLDFVTKAGLLKFPGSLNFLAWAKSIKNSWISFIGILRFKEILQEISLGKFSVL